jgi:hypothetical protein
MCEHLGGASWPDGCPMDSGQLPALVPRGDLVRQPAGYDTVAAPNLGQSVLVGEREAHAREVERSGADWPDGSYGQRNRQAIAARETRIAIRLRAVEHAYHTAIERDTAPTTAESAMTLRPPGHAADMQTDLEAEP